MTIVGTRIKARRKELQLSQRELAEKMGYQNHSTITRIEAGKVDLPQSRIMQFAEVLGTTPGHLMGRDAEPEDLGAMAAQVLLDPAVLTMMEQYMSLSESDQFTVRTLVASLAEKKKD